MYIYMYTYIYMVPLPLDLPLQHLCINTHIYTCVYIHLYMCILCTYVYVYIYVYIYVYTYIYIYEWLYMRMDAYSEAQKSQCRPEKTCTSNLILGFLARIPGEGSFDWQRHSLTAPSSLNWPRRYSKVGPPMACRRCAGRIPTGSLALCRPTVPTWTTGSKVQSTPKERAVFPSRQQSKTSRVVFAGLSFAIHSGEAGLPVIQFGSCVDWRHY